MSDTTMTSEDEGPKKVLRVTENGPTGFASVIKVIVGTEEEQSTFMVHEGVLRANSIFFDKALKGDWEEASDRIVRLPETSPVTFENFVRFVYTGLLFIEFSDSQNDKSGEPGGEPSKKWKIPQLSGRIFMLADYLQASNLWDAILDSIIEVVAQHRDKFSADIATNIYNCTIAGAPIWKSLVDSNLHAWRNKAYEQLNFIAYSLAFLTDFIQAAGPYITTKSVAKDFTNPCDFEKACKYHEHILEGKPCYRDVYQYLTKKTPGTDGT